MPSDVQMPKNPFNTRIRNIYTTIKSLSLHPTLSQLCPLPHTHLTHSNIILPIHQDY